MKKLLMLVIMMTSLMTLSACKKSEPVQSGSSVKTAVEVVDNGAMAPDEDDIIFDFEKVVEVEVTE